MMFEIVSSILDGFVVYVVFITFFYVISNFISFSSVIRYMKNRERAFLLPVYSEFMPEISILAPAYNEEAVIVPLVQSLLQLEYGKYEIIVINDGSLDHTLQLLKDVFSLELVPDMPRVYRSKLYSNLRVLDKENGGKASALNAGIAIAKADLFCSVDADSILQRDSLLAVVQPFLDDRTTIASGGVVRIANGCKIKDGFLVKTGMPKSFLAKLQVMEYIRSFHFGRVAWSQWNALLVISGALGLFSKEAVLRVGGYKAGILGEDMELVVRLHRYFLNANIPYRITFVPDPICWTQVPEDLKTFKNQRIRWQRGLGESLFANRKILFGRSSKTVGFFAFPFFVIFELFGAICEPLALVATVFGFGMGIVKWQSFLAFWGVSIFSGLTISMTALILEELSFPLYGNRLKDQLILFWVAIAENFGYRQLATHWRLWGLTLWVFGKKGSWGTMKRVHHV